MGIFSWIILGLVVGVLAKWIMPGNDEGGFIVTVILGIVGAVIGGYVSQLLGIATITGFNIKSLIFSIIGSLIVLFVYRKIKS
ncbi:MAG: GlsB/YeaQ/YmgE family stress response membrane protein [Plesiomonas sp.]|uniref:GlsB/YeaQ/YmgE family stress response membrane protein n=1 Tax=Plesiomonas sp. TaxID=2486279 RepID=UPI003F2DF8A7